MESIKNQLIGLKNELSLCKDQDQYNETLEKEIGVIATEIISDSTLSKEIDRNSKIFFLSNRLKDTLNRKTLMDKTSFEERTDQMKEFLEQVNSEALYYAEEIFSALLKEFEIPLEKKVPLTQSKKEKPSLLKEIHSKVTQYKQPSFGLHLVIIFSMIIFIVWFHLNSA